jgi:hypothetical protein
MELLLGAEQYGPKADMSTPPHPTIPTYRSPVP